MSFETSRRSEVPGRRTILLVEDEPFVREATCGILQRAGFTVVPADDAQEAIELFEHRNQTIDLVITDLVLPGKNGDELGREIRGRSPDTTVLITSGYSEAAQQAVESPEARTYFLAKPYSRRSLVEKIEAILNTRVQAAQAG